MCRCEGLFTGSAAAIGFAEDVAEASRTALVENKSGVPRSVESRPMELSCFVEQWDINAIVITKVVAFWDSGSW
jgi:hypothetical protein